MGFEESAKNAQSEDCCEPKTACEPKTPEEINLIRKMDGCTIELLDRLRSAENLTKNINQRLLPSMEKPLAKEGKCEQCPNGWFELHLADLRFANSKAVKIISRLQRLILEIKTNKVGQ